MPHVVTYEKAKNSREQRDLPNGHMQWHTDFIAPEEGQEGAQAFLAESTPKRLLRTHYHAVDQFQVVVTGGGVLGKHKLAVHGVHFTRVYTPYGPIVNGEEGIGFLTLRMRRDWKRAQYLPEARAALAAVTDRTPWQVTEPAEFIDSGDASVREFSQIKDERGLAAYAVKLKPHAVLAAPDPAHTDGQYVIVTGGSLIYNGREHEALSIALVKPDEAPMQLVGGPEGLEALVLNYPRLEAAARQAHTAKSPHSRVWQCALCSFTYDEAKGMPEEGIAAGTRWEEVPDTWSCPDCSASKSDFQMSVVS